MDVGFLDHGGQGLFCHAAGFEEAGEVTALAQFRNAQLDDSGAGFSGAVAVALDQPIGAAAAARRAGQVLDLQVHQALGRVTDRLAQKVAIGRLLQESL